MTRTLTILVACLFTAWLASVAVLLCFLAQLAPVPWLVGAVVAQVGVACVGGGVLLVTNTRRPAGINPDARPAILYGRREDDDQSVTEQLSEVLERAAAKRPASTRTPAWFIDTHEDAASVFAEEDKHE